MKLVEIVWEDAQRRDGDAWVDKQDWEYKPCHILTVGYVLYESEEGYIITDSVAEDSTGSVHQIPAGMIVSVEVLSGTV